MSLETFLYNLHFATDKASSPDWKVDWENAPLPYKLYRGLPVVPLSLETPLSLDAETSAKPCLSTLGHFLWYIFGLTQFSQTVLTSDSTKQVDLIQSYRRFVPSGGALYPNELYVYLKVDELPAGIYHYDAAHHRLVLLREGNFDSYIGRALGNRCQLSTCFGTVFVSTMFWKNFFKYNNFSYRLQGLDSGVLIGQLLEVAKRFGYATKVYFQFLDRAINHLLGLSEQEETVYAVIPLTIETSVTENDKGADVLFSSTQLCRELKEIHLKQNTRQSHATEYPMLIQINEASMLESTQSFGKIKQKQSMKSDGPAIALPHVERLSYDLASVCRRRFSPNTDFVLGKVSDTQLAALLKEAAASYVYHNDLDEPYGQSQPRVALYGCFYNVEGLQNGAYYYESTAHALRPIHLGDHRLQLQYGMFPDNVNLFQVPLCLHVAGEKDHLISGMGYRGYRIQQMEAGMLVQRLLLAASAMGFGGHPLLGFDVSLCDDIYKMNLQGKTSLIQIPLGPYRDRNWLQGSLHS